MIRFFNFGVNNRLGAHRLVAGWNADGTWQHYGWSVSGRICGWFVSVTFGPRWRVESYVFRYAPRPADWAIRRKAR